MTESRLKDADGKDSDLLHATERRGATMPPDNTVNLGHAGQQKMDMHVHKTKADRVSKTRLEGKIVGSIAQHLAAEIHTIFSGVKYGIQHFVYIPKNASEYAVCTDEDSRSTTTLLTLQVDLPEEYVKMMRANRLRYAKKHGVRYCEYSHSLDDSLSPVWSKILAIQELFKKEYPTVMWMDADALIMDHDKNVDDIVVNYAPKDAIFSAEFSYERGTAPYAFSYVLLRINLGVFIIKNTRFSTAMLKSANEDASALREPLQEQVALNKFAIKNSNNFSEHVVIVPWNEFNSNNDQFRHGDFIIHWAGCRIDHRTGKSKYDSMLSDPLVQEKMRVSDFRSTSSHLITMLLDAVSHSHLTETLWTLITHKKELPTEARKSEPQLSPEDAGIAGLARFLMDFGPVTWTLICMALLLWLVWNTYLVAKQVAGDGREDQTMFNNLGYAVTWMSLGVGVIMFNKCLFMKSGIGFGFPYPLLLNWYHMFFTTIFTHAVRKVSPDSMPTLSSLDTCTYFCNVVPIAFVQMISLSCGSKAYLYISVSYIQMIKNTKCAFVFFFSILMGFEGGSGARAAAIGLVICGMMLGTSGEAYFNLFGFALATCATSLDGCRVCLTKALMSTKYSVNLDTLSACCASSSSVCLLLTIPMLLIDAPKVTFAEIWPLRFALCANSLMVVCLNVASMGYMKMVGPTTFILTGVLKDVAMIATLLALFSSGAGLEFLKACGFLTTFVGFLGFNYFNVTTKK